MAPWLLHFDGLYEPRYSDHGYATFGFLVVHGGATLHEAHGLVAGPGGVASANVAEFGALIEGLTWARDHAAQRGECPLRVRGDSRLVVETVGGRWHLHSDRLLPLHALAVRLADEAGAASFEKVRRDDPLQQRADALSRVAYHEVRTATERRP